MAKDYSPNITPANQQRRPQNAMDDDWVRAFLARARVGHLASRWDEQLFITPTNFWYDPQRHEIYFHSNFVGRMRANLERHPLVCLEACEMGELLPSNVALEFSIQYESAVVYGTVRILQDEAERIRALHNLIAKYFPGMAPGQHYRPVTAEELRRTTVYALAIDSWSGKRNWKERAEQSEAWPPLDPEWLK